MMAFADEKVMSKSTTVKEITYFFRSVDIDRVVLDNFGQPKPSGMILIFFQFIKYLKFNILKSSFIKYLKY